MVDLAKEAFITNNFGLAVDIYERIIRENGPTSELYLGLADSLAHEGNFSKAFQSYKFAYRYGKVTPEKLKHLVAGLIEKVKVDMNNDELGVDGKTNLFTCGVCFGILSDPITMPCGHTFCRHCLDKRFNSQSCVVCGIVHFRLNFKNLNSNVVLVNLIEKWLPSESKAGRLKMEGNEYVLKGNYLHAITIFSKAIELSPNDHRIRSNRSHAYAAVNQYEEALADAEAVIALLPHWPKGYYRKGLAKFGLKKYEDATVAFLQCLALNQKMTTAKDYLSKTLDKILSAFPSEDPKAETLQQKNYPTMLQKLVEHNFSSPLLMSDIAITIQELTQTVKDSITKARKSGSNGPTPQIHYMNTGDGSVKVRYDHERTSEAETKDEMLADKPNSSPSSRKRLRNPSLSSCPTSPVHSSPYKLIKAVSETGEDNTYASSLSILNRQKNIEDLECGLCYRLFYEPVTTPCGHTFCRKCLDRCLDHTVTCPLCKGNLAEYLAERRQAVTESIQSIIETYFKEEYLERCRINEEEMVELTRMGLGQQSDIPVFVCTLSFPTIPCPLHIFEPRYRLMIRQCMESGTRQFGMCMHLSDADSEFSDYGCMLEIRDVQYFPDGRSLVDTIGGRRFKVLSRGKRDGYNTAKVEFLSDKPVSAEEFSAVNSLQIEVHSAVQYWLARLPSFRQSRIIEHFGELPQLDSSLSSVNGPNWGWWALAVLPLDNRVQLTMLGMCSFQDRLLALKKILEFLNRRSSQ